MAGLMLNGSMIQGLVYNGNPVSAMYNGQLVWPDASPGPSFETVTIGNQTWMAKNLAIDDGQGGVSSVDNVIGADNVSFGTQYYYTSTAARRIASSVNGWHLPTSAEFNTLIQAIGSANSRAKLASTTGWYYSNGTNAYGYNAQPVGHLYKGSLSETGENVSYWSNTSASNDYQYGLFLSTDYTVAKIRDLWAARNMFSVRLIKD